ncbi:hypothetical protein K466DRAFT_372751 [Polyporus arcularius HHB13444]|uniref:Secreted protein n=1 Tax=Polyporus arcularius HHB13444 TaxID=1314778 RepID=A0A5C3PMA5_9APHY|nr:hypothetical protein K466DRAFT_372751 [Polyporus arcularius HHB13444]
MPLLTLPARWRLVIHKLLQVLQLARTLTIKAQSLKRHMPRLTAWVSSTVVTSVRDSAAMMRLREPGTVSHLFGSKRCCIDYCMSCAIKPRSSRRQSFAHPCYTSQHKYPPDG